MQNDHASTSPSRSVLVKRPSSAMDSESAAPERGCSSRSLEERAGAAATVAPPPVKQARLASALPSALPQVTMRFPQPQLWKRSYIRTRHKNLRCFPSCFLRHLENGFCGVSVFVDLKIEGGPAAVSDLDLAVVGILRKRDGDHLHAVGERIDAGLPAAAQENDVYEADWCEFDPARNCYPLEFKPPRRWRYECRLAKHTMKQEHVFTAYAMSRSRGVCVASQDSPPFRLTSAWKQPTTQSNTDNSSSALSSNGIGSRGDVLQQLPQLPQSNIEEIMMRTTPPAASQAGVPTLPPITAYLPPPPMPSVLPMMQHAESNGGAGEWRMAYERALMGAYFAGKQSGAAQQQQVPILPPALLNSGASALYYTQQYQSDSQSSWHYGGGNSLWDPRFSAQTMMPSQQQQAPPPQHLRSLQAYNFERARSNQERDLNHETNNKF